jgi:hypothetical protein
MSFFDKSEKFDFDGENFKVDTTVKQKIIESHQFTIRTEDTDGFGTQSCNATMDSKGELRINFRDYTICRNKKELKKFISWLIIAYKDIFND